jgi:hypothetical protein
MRAIEQLCCIGFIEAWFGGDRDGCCEPILPRHFWLTDAIVVGGHYRMDIQDFAKRTICSHENGGAWPKIRGASTWKS